MVKRVVIRSFRALLILLLGAALIQHAMAQFGLSTRLLAPSLSPVTTTLTVTVLALTAVSLIVPLIRRGGDRFSLVTSVLAVIALLLVAPFTFMTASFGRVDLETILISLADNRTTDLVDVAIKDFSGPLIEHFAIAGIMIFAAWYLMRRMPGAVPVLFVVSLVFIAESQPVKFLIGRVFPDPALALISEEDLRAPVVIAEPETQPNLVIVYLESLERSYRDIPAAADAFSAFARFEDEGFSARNVAQFRGTHFSAAGLIATHCGVPLYPRGLYDPRAVKTTQDAEAFNFGAFMPGIRCLGDLLVERGYEGSYVNGSDADIFAIADFLESHGYSTVRGLKSEAEYADVEGTNTWGTPDTVLFDVAKEETARLAEGGDPFFITIFTASTHGPAGYLDPGCEYEPPIAPAQADSLIPATIHCSGALVDDYLRHLEDLGVADNTVVAVMSDHLAMPNTMIRELRSVGAARRNLFTILNGPDAMMGQSTERPATVMDIFPTLMEAMGYQLQDGAGNLGRSLLGPNPTLSEQLGLDVLDRAVLRNPGIRRLVWEVPE